MIPGTASDVDASVFRWTAEEGILLIPRAFPGQYTSVVPWDVSGDGSAIVGQVYGSSQHHTFIWDTDRGMRDLQQALVEEYRLNLDGWILSDTVAISHDGRTIVGTGVAPHGSSEGWVAYLGRPPCPADLNDDRGVDQRDLMVLLESFGLDAGGDTDDDGDTDLTDLAILLSAFGTACP